MVSSSFFQTHHVMVQQYNHASSYKPTYIAQAEDSKEHRYQPIWQCQFQFPTCAPGLSTPSSPMSSVHLPSATKSHFHIIHPTSPRSAPHTSFMHHRNRRPSSHMLLICCICYSYVTYVTQMLHMLLICYICYSYVTHMFSPCIQTISTL